jgi:predicted PurR-regulated permease PerM
VAILYFVVETVESSVIYPLAQRHVVHIPPAYTVLIQIGGGLVGGIPGVILATPIAVAAGVAIQMLYVQDVLGEPVEVLGDQ